jgi:MoaA/NifB/PqqE/SkfB family radical SAM enzyme
MPVLTKPAPVSYKPLPGHPRPADINARADELVKQALKVIETDKHTLKEKIDEAQRVADALTTTAQSYAANYKRLSMNDHTLLPPYMIWTMHNTCNFRCSYCDNHRGEKYFDLKNDGKLDTEQGKKLLAVIRKNTTGIYFCGGEPTVRLDLPDMVDEAHRLNFFPLMINTNGSRIHKMLPDPRYKNFLKKMDIIIVSMDALNIERLAAVWGVKEDLCEQVIANIVALRRLQKRVRFKLMVNTVITPDTIHEADSVLDWANHHDIWFSPVPMNCGPRVNNVLLENSDYQALVSKIMKRKEQGHKILGSRRLIKDLLEGNPIKCYPSLKPHVDIDGSLIWPCKVASNIEPVKVNLLKYDSLDAAYEAASEIIDPTDIHGHGAKQCGSDCNWMQNYTTDAYVRGLQKPIGGGLVRELFEFAGVV